MGAIIESISFKIENLRQAGEAVDRGVNMCSVLICLQDYSAFDSVNFFLSLIPKTVVAVQPKRNFSHPSTCVCPLKKCLLSVSLFFSSESFSEVDANLDSLLRCNYLKCKLAVTLMLFCNEVVKNPLHSNITQGENMYHFSPCFLKEIGATKYLILK